MSENTSEVTKISAGTVIGGESAGDGKATPSSLTDATKITEDTVNKMLKTFSTRSMTLSDKGLAMRTALETAYVNINPVRKDAGLAPLRLKNNMLNPNIIARIIYDHFIIRKLVQDASDFAAVENADLYIYNDPKSSIPMSNPTDGMFAGIYTILNEDSVARLAMYVQSDIDLNGVKNVFSKLRAIAEVAELDMNRDHVFCHNGIFDYGAQKLLPFSPDFPATFKLSTDYNPDAKPCELKPNFFTNDIVEKVTSYSYTADVIYQVIGAAVRCRMDWTTMFWLYGRVGSNGKTMIKELIVSLVGNSVVSEMDLADYAGKNFDLEGIYGKHVLVTSDSNKGDYLDALGTLKKLTGRDAVQIKRKYKAKEDYRFRGVILMLMNAMPQLKYEKALDRRIVKVEFDKVFLENAVDEDHRADPRIVEDFIHRPEVKEWILYHVLSEIPMYYKVTTPAETQANLEESFLEDQNVIIRFMKSGVVDEIMGIDDYENGKIVAAATGGENTVAEPVDLDQNLLFNIFLRWCERSNEMQKGSYGQRKFNQELANTIKDYPDLFKVEFRDDRRRIYYSVPDASMKDFANRVYDYLVGTTTMSKEGLNYMFEMSRDHAILAIKKAKTIQSRGYLTYKKPDPTDKIAA